jgi:hypothetical protein
MHAPGSLAAELHGKRDGRRRRSIRTRQADIRAYLDLVQAKRIKPATAEVAARAGCSIRSVFERFHTIEALELAALDHLIVELELIAPDMQFGGDRQARIGAYVRMRATKCETWFVHWRVLRGSDLPSEARITRLAAVRQRDRDCILAAYDAELSAVDEVSRRNIVIALQGLTEFESWGLMRDAYGLSLDEGCKVWAEAIDRLLPLAVDTDGKPAPSAVHDDRPGPSVER